MIPLLRDALAFLRGLSRRNSRWGKARRAHLAANPACVACGARKKLEAHHVLPYRTHPERELDPGNLVTLCRVCHFVFGHLKSWKAANPFVREDAAAYRARLLGVRQHSSGSMPRP